jgi:hypothetical protein
MPISSADLAKASKTSLDYYLKNAPIDQIGVEVPLYNKLMAKRKQFNGAKQNIVVQLRKSYDSNFNWANLDSSSSGYGTVTFNRRDTMAQAFFPWSRCQDGFYIPYDELFSNGIDVKEGGSKEFKLNTNEKVQLTNLMEEQIETFRTGFIEKLSLELHRDGTNETDAVTGLDALVSTTPATGSVGGINRATAGNEWWRNNASTGIASTTAGALATEMEKMWRACIRNGGQPDFILAGSDFIDAYRQYAVTVTNNADAAKVKSIDAGVGSGSSTGLYFKGIEIIWDPQFADLDALESGSAIPWEKRCYFLNTKHIELHDNGIDIVTPTRPHDTLSFFQMVTQRMALVLKRANAHAVLSIA